MKEIKNNLYSSIAFLLFGIFVFAASNLIQPTTSDILGSRFFPRVVAGLICFLAILQIITSAVKLKAESAKDEEKEEKSGFSRPLILTILLLFVYYVLILYFGFTITSIFYLLAQSAILMSKDDFKDKKKVIIMLVVAIVVPIFINTIFWNVFSIALPSGKLF